MNKENVLKNTKASLTKGLLLGREIAHIPTEFIKNISLYFFLEEKTLNRFKLEHNVKSNFLLKIETSAIEQCAFSIIIIMTRSEEELAQLDYKLLLKALAINGKLMLYINAESNLQNLLHSFIESGYTFVKLTRLNIDEKEYLEVIIEKDDFKYQQLMTKYFYHVHAQISALNGNT